MQAFVIGITGGVGGLLARGLVDRGDSVSGLVRRQQQQDDLAAKGLVPIVGELSQMSASDLAAAIRGSDALVFAAGSNGGDRAVTDAIDGRGQETAVEAARLAGVHRFISVSVLPEAERELDLHHDVEHYFAVKKAADVTLSQTELDWVILRPSRLVDGPGAGTVTLGPAALHGQIARVDVAETLAELLHEPRVSRQILELDQGARPIWEAVLNNVRPTVA